MSPPPIPQFIPPLRWRAPAILWIPLALAVAIGWPMAALSGEGLLARALPLGDAIAFVLGMVTLGAGWAAGRAPRTYRAVVLHIVVAGVMVSLAAPFVLASLIKVAGAGENADAASGLSFAAALAMAPFAVLVGLPASLLSGVTFALLALVKPKRFSPDPIAS